MLFIDELAHAGRRGRGRGGHRRLHMLKPARRAASCSAVGASTLNDYSKYIEKDGASSGLPGGDRGSRSVEETVEILKGLRKKYEATTLSFPTRTLRAAAEPPTATSPTPSCRTRAIDVIDEAGARAGSFPGAPRGNRGAQADSTRSTPRRNRRSRPELRAGGRAARQASATCKPIRMRQEEGKGAPDQAPVIDEEAVAFIVSRWTGIPLTRLQEAADGPLLRMRRKSTWP